MTTASNIADPAWTDPAPLVTRRKWQYRAYARRVFVRRHLDDGADVESESSIRALAAIAQDLKLWQAQVPIAKVAEDLLVLIKREQHARRQADLKRRPSPA